MKIYQDKNVYEATQERIKFAFENLFFHIFRIPPVKAGS